jgi:hypothetical protein
MCSLKTVFLACYSYTAFHHQIAINILDYIKQQNRTTRQYHPRKFRNVQTSSNTYKYSSFPRTIKDWNNLPSSMLVTEPGSLLYWCLMKRVDLLCTISIFLIWFAWYGSQALLAYSTLGLTIAWYALFFISSGNLLIFVIY